MADAVQSHVTMCDTLVTDLVVCLLQAQDEITKSKLLGIEPDQVFNYSEQGQQLIADYQSKQLAKIEEAKVEFKQPEI